MRFVHLSDLHLGYRQYQRQTPSGINQREADVAAAFRKAIRMTIDLQPDLVLIGGDIFHNVRPTNPAILHAFMEFSRLVEMLPECDIIMIAGNHDLPRTSETGFILPLFKSLGIRVVTNEPTRISLNGGEVSVLAIPYGIRPRPSYDPDPSARHNILFTHDEVEGVVQKFGTLAERAVGDLTLQELSPERWSYVALGHYHVYHSVAPNAYYSGSLEYTSTNIWGEAYEEVEKRVDGKGFIEHDLETGKHTFHHIEPQRRVINLPELSAVGLTAEALSVAINESVNSCKGGIEDQIVRLVVRDVPRHVLRDLDHKAIREYKRRALHFQLDARRPQPIRTEASGAPGRRTSLTDTVRAMLEKRALTPGINREALVELGLRYLAEADRTASVTVVDPE
jgi:exonuclease SbcD